MKTPKERRERFYIALILAAFFALLALFIFSGDNLKLLKRIFLYDLSQEQLQDTFSIFNWRDYLMVVILAAMQVICSFLPAEPVQVLSGCSFGFPVGILCCMIGVAVGGTVIFLLQKAFGDKPRDFFVKKLHLDLEKIALSSKCILIIFALYLLPAIPYGMICFFAAGTGMRYRRYITVTLLGALPSVCVGVALGYMTIASHWIVAACVFTALLALIAFLWAKKDILFTRVNTYAEAHKNTSQVTAREPNRFLLGVLYHMVKTYFALCGVRIKATSCVENVEKPAMVLCNHGSFIDFIYAATLVRRYRPNFVIARLYFYDNILRWLLKNLGGFPKSMFALDAASTKNCLRVLKNNGLLVMMPEARLSTVGRFEDIQNSTYSFIKKAGVPVYTVKFGGDYFADPKWGKGFRRGSVVEAELDILFTAEDVQTLSVAEIKRAVEERLSYDEFRWLEERPHIRYRSSRMAEGLENILAACPICGRRHTIVTKKDKVFCEACGYLTSVDDRYAFTGGFQFQNLAQWYDWQKELLRESIVRDPDFALTSPVELRLKSTGYGLTRAGGQGVCTLTREGLTYCGTRDGEQVQLQFPLEKIYRLLFGAGVNFEVYDGADILFFVPEEKRGAVDWYMASMILYDEVVKTAVHA